MEILYVSDAPAGSARGGPLLRLARVMAERGHRCLVVAPADATGRPPTPPGDVDLLTPREAVRRLSGRRPDLRPDLIHAWSPGEPVQRLTRRAATAGGGPVVTHLARHPEAVEPEALPGGGPFSWRGLEGRRGPTDPSRTRRIVAQADGVTVAGERLREFVPPDRPWIVCRPTATVAAASPREAGGDLRARHGLGAGEFVVFHRGEITPTSAPAVAELMQAVDWLNRQGIRARLVRAGGPDRVGIARRLRLPRAWYRDLGRIADEECAAWCAAADAVVEPGGGEAFADYGFSAAAAEFLASGTPAVLPATGAGRLLTDGEEALLTRTGGAAELTGKLTRIHDDPRLRDRLGRGGRHFAANHLNGFRTAEALEGLYAEVRNRRP